MAATAAIQAGLEGATTPVKARLDVLLLYEDLGTALRAKHSLDYHKGATCPDLSPLLIRHQPFAEIESAVNRIPSLLRFLYAGPQKV